MNDSEYKSKTSKSKPSAKVFGRFLCTAWPIKLLARQASPLDIDPTTRLGQGDKAELPAVAQEVRQRLQGVMERVQS